MTDKAAPLTVAMAKRIEMWPLDRLVPYERNSRLHSPEQIAQVAASIAEFGFVNPVLVDSNDGIIAGHGRLAAAKELGLSELPVVVLDHLSDRQRRAYVIADNKLALNASWDVDMLAMEVDALRDEDFNLDLLGFSEDELKGLAAEVDELEEMPELADGDRQPIQQMTFTLHDDQAEILKEAIQKAKAIGPFVDTGNENSNGNAIARVAELFLSWGGDHGLG
jgi:ParB-like chromosome segregation protein Spo0J